MRSYAQKDPLVEYKKESWELFKGVMDRIEDETIRYLYFMQRVEHPPEAGQHVDWSEVGDGEEFDADAQAQAEAEREAAEREAEAKAAQHSVMDFTRNIQRKKEKELDALQFVGGGEASKPAQPVLAKKTPGRNDSCGSGKKYKKCHGA